MCLITTSSYSDEQWVQREKHSDLRFFVQLEGDKMRRLEKDPPKVSMAKCLVPIRKTVGATNTCHPRIFFAPGCRANISSPTKYGTYIGFQSRRSALVNASLVNLGGSPGALTRGKPLNHSDFAGSQFCSVYRSGVARICHAGQHPPRRPHGNRLPTT